MLQLIQVLGSRSVGASAISFFFKGAVVLAQQYTVTDLGTLGGNSSTATAINETGQIVGVSATAQGREHAFLWHNGAMTC